MSIVRIDNPAELAGLSSGLSAEVTVDTSNGHSILAAQAAE